MASRISEFIFEFACNRYGDEIVQIDRKSIVLRDHTQIFVQKLYLDLTESDPQEWPDIANHWFGFFDLIRTRISSQNAKPGGTSR